MDKLLGFKNKLNDGSYDLLLEIAEDEYLDIYDNIDLKSGEDLLRNYLISTGDDARFNSLDINHNKARRIITLNAKLNYEGNEHTDYPNRNKLM